MSRHMVRQGGIGLVWLAILLIILAGCETFAPDNGTVSGSAEETTWAMSTTRQTEQPNFEPVLLGNLVDGRIYQICCQGGQALILTAQGGDTALLLYDLASGQSLRDKSFRGVNLWADFLADGIICVLDREAGEVQLLDQSLEPVGGAISYPGSQAAVQTDDACVWSWEQDGAGITRTGLLDGGQKNYALPDWNWFWLTGFEADGVILEGTDQEDVQRIYRLCPSSGEVLPAPALQGGYAPDLQTMAFHTELETVLYPLDAPGEIYCLEGVGEQRLSVRKDNMAVLSSYEDNTLLVCELTEGRCWRLEQQTGTVACDLEGETLVYATTDGVRSSLYRWAFSTAPAVDAVACTFLSQEQLARENRTDQDWILQQTGLRVYCGKAGVEFNDPYPSGYTGEILENPILIHLALRMTKDFISQYPTGIFQEMAVEPVRHIDLYFCGRIFPDAENSISSAYGFTSQMGERRIVVMSLEDLDTLPQNLAHEFTHVMEDRVYACTQERGLDYLTYWEALSPPESYYYSYFDETGEEVSDAGFTAESAPEDLEEVWFLDAYSKTYPSEDRARILEYLFAGEESRYAHAFQGEQIRRKAQYLCAVIRECFPSAKAAQDLPWERMIAVPPFSEFQEAVQTYVPIAQG